MDELKVFLNVARLQSFTKAAARLRVTPSAVSHAIKSLEDRLGIKLFARTTRSISTTEAGNELLNEISPLMDQIDDALHRINTFREKPKGTIRITAADDTAQYLILPILSKFLDQYPDVNIEVITDYAYVDIVDQGFDAGIRLGESLNKNMIATKISNDWRQLVVAAPSYLNKKMRPMNPNDLLNHNCINIRYSNSSGIYIWEFEKKEQKLNLKVNGQFTTNNVSHQLDAAINGVGIAYLPEYIVDAYLKEGKLVTVLEDWCPYFEGYYMYYPHRRKDSPAFMAFLQILRNQYQNQKI